jgi:hypothetical protein
MKYSLPNLTCSLAIGWSLLLAVTMARAAGTEVPGQHLIAEASSRLALQPAIAARIRQQANLFGQELVGAGTYQQVLADGRTLIRLELKLQIDDQLTTLQQINDGAVLWLRRDRMNEKRVSYVNLRRVRDAAKQSQSGSGEPVGVESLAIGGLPQLLQGLERNFDFDSAREEMLGSVPVWVTRGKWKKERLARILADQAEKGSGDPMLPAGTLPPQLPDRVTVVLGRDDFVPLFPYRVEYGRTSANPTDDASKNGAGQGTEDVSTIVRMEFFEVRRQWDIDPSAFRYPYGDQVIEDHTDVYLRRLGLLDTPNQAK